MMRGARKWFHKDADGLDEPQKKLLPEIFANSQKLQTYFQLRRISPRSGIVRPHRANSFSRNCRIGAIAQNKAASRRCRNLRRACAATPDSKSIRI